MLKRALIPFALAAAFLCAPFVARAPSAWADTPDAGAGAGSGSAVEVGSAALEEKPSDAVTNPAEHPAKALSDVQLARKTSWPLAIWLVLAMIGKALAYSRDKLKNTPILGKLAAWLAKGKGAMVVAAFGAIGAAGYNVLVDGGTWTAALVASGVALGGVMHSTTKGAPQTPPSPPS